MEGGNQPLDNDLWTMNRTAPFSVLLTMLICVASFQPAAAVGAPPSGSLNVGRSARPWKLSCTNGISGAFASAVTPIPHKPAGSATPGPKPTASPQPNVVVLTNGRVNASSAAWKNSFGRGTNSPPQRCTLELHREPLSAQHYTLTGAQPSKLVNAPDGQVSELVLVYSGISLQDLQVTP